MQQVNYIVESTMRFYQNYGNGSVNVTVMRAKKKSRGCEIAPMVGAIN